MNAIIKGKKAGERSSRNVQSVPTEQEGQRESTGKEQQSPDLGELGVAGEPVHEHANQGKQSGESDPHDGVVHALKPSTRRRRYTEDGEDYVLGGNGIRGGRGRE